MTRILAFALGVAIGTYIGIRLVYTQEPLPEPLFAPEHDDGVQPPDPWPSAYWTSVGQA